MAVSTGHIRTCLTVRASLVEEVDRAHAVQAEGADIAPPLQNACIVTSWLKRFGWIIMTP